MTTEEIVGKISGLEECQRRNEGRFDKLEKKQENLEKLTEAVATVAAEQKTIGKAVDKLDAKVDELKQKPGERWEHLVSKALDIIIGAVVGYALIKLGF